MLLVLSYVLRIDHGQLFAFEIMKHHLALYLKCETCEFDLKALLSSMVGSPSDSVLDC